jgi:putative iron-regulated protein
MAYDQMLARDNAEGGALIQAGIDALIAQTRTIERITAALGVEGLSIDAPGAVGPSATE